jgi:hypothetical protein
MNPQFKLYQHVILSKDLPEENLQKGDVAAIVEIIEKENKTSFCREFLIMKEPLLKLLL